MIAAARVRRYQLQLAQANHYVEELEDIYQVLCSVAQEKKPSLMRSREVQTRTLVVFTSDRGLCGGFNSNVLRKLENECFSAHSLKIFVVGRKGTSFLARRAKEVQGDLRKFWGSFSWSEAEKLGRLLMEDFLNQKTDRVDLVYNEFISVMKQETRIMSWLPLSCASSKDPVEAYLFEPQGQMLLEDVASHLLTSRLYRVCLSSLAGEYGARMTAMDCATRSAREMMDRLTLDMNRARQASITGELVEIISGAEAIAQGG